MEPTIYVDMRSQPCRAVVMFLSCSTIPHIISKVDVLKGDQKKPEYSSLCPLMKVPGMKDGSLSISESVAIIRYLAAKFPDKYPDHWYPADLSRRAKIDEYISFHHQGMREPLSGLVEKILFVPEPLPKERIDEQVKFCNVSLDVFERVFISNTPFISGDEISVADALAVNEILDTNVCGYDFTKDRPKLKEYVDRIRTRLGPDLFDQIYEESKQWAKEIKESKQ
ncbi:glutathione S-transferase theta-3-like [Lytechinus pictus]|uniref:glutathione S-transferase theta-3-like n=1 Tax=Lytechinus pictus TaxID=7653 RepID=UPI0030B9B594